MLFPTGIVWLLTAVLTAALGKAMKVWGPRQSTGERFDQERQEFISTIRKEIESVVELGREQRASAAIQLGSARLRQEFQNFLRTSRWH